MWDAWRGVASLESRLNHPVAATDGSCGGPRRRCRWAALPSGFAHSVMSASTDGGGLSQACRCLASTASPVEGRLCIVEVRNTGNGLETLSTEYQRWYKIRLCAELVAH